MSKQEDIDRKAREVLHDLVVAGKSVGPLEGDVAKAFFELMMADVQESEANEMFEGFFGERRPSNLEKLARLGSLDPEED